MPNVCIARYEEYTCNRWFCCEGLPLLYYSTYKSIFQQLSLFMDD